MWRLILVLMILAPAAVRGEPLTVFVSVLPLKTFVERVGGSHVRVRTMVQPGHNPATYEPTTRQVAALAQADLYVQVGVPFEAAWMARIGSVSPAMRVLDARAGIELLLPVQQGHDHHQGQGPVGDPHVWTSPRLVGHLAANIRDALIELDPSHRDSFEAGYQQFANELDALDREIRDLLATLENRSFMVFHPAWSYFADAYDLTQVPIEKEGKEPGPKSLVALVARARGQGVQVIFVQPQFARGTAQRLASAIGGRVEVADPLAADYADNLRRFARLILEANGS